jgi:hypothetical protein
LRYALSSRPLVVLLSVGKRSCSSLNCSMHGTLACRTGHITTQTVSMHTKFVTRFADVYRPVLQHTTARRGSQFTAPFPTVAPGKSYPYQGTAASTAIPCWCCCMPTLMSLPYSRHSS